MPVIFNIDFDENKITIGLLVVFIASLAFVFYINNWKLQIPRSNNIIQTVTIETLENINNNVQGIAEKKQLLDELDFTPEKSFCQSYSQSHSAKDMEKACNALTANNCKNMDCCVWVNNGKCSAGNSDGPIFKTSSDGEKIAIDSYYYKNKCYGNKCLDYLK